MGGGRFLIIRNDMDFVVMHSWRRNIAYPGEELLIPSLNLTCPSLPGGTVSNELPLSLERSYRIAPVDFEDGAILKSSTAAMNFLYCAILFLGKFYL